MGGGGVKMREVEQLEAGSTHARFKQARSSPLSVGVFIFFTDSRNRSTYSDISRALAALSVLPSPLSLLPSPSPLSPLPSPSPLSLPHVSHHDMPAGREPAPGAGA